MKQFFVNLTASKAFENGKVSQYSQIEKAAFYRLNRVWSLFFPDRNEHFVTSAAGENVQSGFDLFLKGRGDDLIPLDCLSSGEIEILTLFSSSIDQKEESGIIFVDEPELHLHPAWQRKVLLAFREIFPAAQLITATHSPQVISEIPAESVFLLKNTNGRMTVTKPECAYGLDSNRILEDLMGVTERPSEVKEKLSHLFACIERNNLQEAREIVMEIKDSIPIDPEITKAETLIRRKEIIGR